MRHPFLLVVLGGFLLGAVIGAGMLLFSADTQRTRVVTSGKALVGGPFELVGKGLERWLPNNTELVLYNPPNPRQRIGYKLFIHDDGAGAPVPS